MSCLDKFSNEDIPRFAHEFGLINGVSHSRADYASKNAKMFHIKFEAFSCYICTFVIRLYLLRFFGSIADDPAKFDLNVEAM